MKEEINKLQYVITKQETMRVELQRLWDKIDPKDFRRYTIRLIVKMEDVITYKGYATTN